MNTPIRTAWTVTVDRRPADFADGMFWHVEVTDHRDGTVSVRDYETRAFTPADAVADLLNLAIVNAPVPS